MDGLRSLADESVQTVCTSPPYWGLRDYGVAGQLGLEATPQEFVARMVAVFAEVRRVLRPDGVLWLNIGDSYAASGRGGGGGSFQDGDVGTKVSGANNRRAPADGFKPKDLVGIPWRLAFALQQPQYLGQIREERDRVWLAAMLDAEGCLFIHRRKAGQSNGQGYVRQSDTYGPGVEICNTSEVLVQRIAALVGKGSISVAHAGAYGRKQTLYRWNLRTTECRDFVREVYPHLVAKKQQARILVGCPSSGERAAAAHAALIALHRTGISDVDFPEPEPMFGKGWWLRSECIWAKSNPMPESVTDRPTKSHEQVFLLTKSDQYFYDAAAIRQKYAETSMPEKGKAYEGQATKNYGAVQNPSDVKRRVVESMERNGGANARTVWTIATQPYAGAHFATFPEALAERCILSGSSAARCADCGSINSHEESTKGEVSRVRKAIPFVKAVQDGGVLFENVREQGDSAEQAVNEGLRDNAEGLHRSVPPRSPDGLEDGVHLGAPARHGAGARPESSSLGSRGSHQRDQEGQPEEESEGDEQAGSRRPLEPRAAQDGPLPELRRPIRAQRVCRKCGGDLRPDVVLDCFAGSGTTGAVALAHGRSFIGIELNQQYVRLARRRIIGSRPLFAPGEEVR